MILFRKFKCCIFEEDITNIAESRLHLLKYNVKLLKIIGLTKDGTNYFIIFAINCIGIILTLASFAFVMQEENDLADKIEPIIAAIYMIGCSLKYAVIIYEKEKLFDFIDCVESIWMENENKEFMPILFKTERRSSLFVIFVSFNYSMMIFIITMTPLIYYFVELYILDNPDAQLITMIRVNYGLKIDELTVYVLTAVGAWIIIILIFSMDALFPPLAFHTAAIFQLLDKRLINIINNSMVLNNTNEFRLKKELFKTNASFVKLQSSAIKCANILEEIFNIPMLIHMSISSLKICFVLWKISSIGSSNYTSSDPPSMWVIFLGVLFSELVVNMTYCYCGDKIDNEVPKSFFTSYACLMASSVTKTLYDMNWYKIKDIKLRKMIHMLLHLTQARIVITAGKFYIIRKETFIQILKGAYAYFTVMHRAAE